MLAVRSEEVTIVERKGERRMERQKQGEEYKHKKLQSTDHVQSNTKPSFHKDFGRTRPGDQKEIGNDNASETSSMHRKIQDWIDVNDTRGVQTRLHWNPQDDDEGRQAMEGSISSDESDDQLLDMNLWDRFLIVPRDNRDENSNFIKVIKGFKVVCYLLFFAIVLGTCVINKLSILTLATGLTKNITTGSSGSDPKITMLLIAVCFPYLSTLITYSSRSLFGGAGWPSFKMTAVILTIELGHTAGLCLLVFRVLPDVDMMRALILMTSIYTGPAILKFVFTLKSWHKTAAKKCWSVTVGLLCIGIQALSLTTCAYVRFSMTSLEQHVVKRSGNLKTSSMTSIVHRPGSESSVFNWEVPVALVLISFVFWENFIESDAKIFGQNIPFTSWRKNLHLVRQRLYVVVSLWKIIWSVLFAVLMVDGFDFTLTFQDSDVDTNSHLLHYGPLYCILVSSVVCSYFCGLVCKLNMQTVSFALPLSLVAPTTFVVIYLRCHHSFLPVSDSPYLWVCSEGWSDILPYHWALLGAVWLSQLFLCSHIWQSKSARMAKIEKLFVTPVRCSVLTGESLMLRRRTSISEKTLEKGIDEYSKVDSNDEYIVPQIYACATMWHETRQEMTKLLKSIFRMDIDHSARAIAQKYYKIKDPDYYEFEAHVLFDDAFDVIGDDVIKPNQFVARFIECLDEAISSVHERPTTMGPPVRTSVPYGGKLTWTLPGGTTLVVHLKDKSRIRNRKRWSQVMYLYYLLGYKLLAGDVLDNQDGSYSSGSVDEEPVQEPSKKGLTSAELRHRRKSAFFSRSVIFDYVTEDVKIKADNTYVLALDGDVDFKPEAVHLLVDRMKKNKKVGAACGRVHPVGSGPIVWYQQFEYAIGHWLQKAMEHVFGCVLCAPGCFSLFRGSALMDDNVAKTYTIRSTEAGHYIQFDQGEDRWLSTLLLQQGYRIDYCAAADALTQAPETFNELFNQRRRWGPSTLANLFDLLGSWKSTVHMNDNISTLYMFYQALMLTSSLLGPATVLLMMAGAFQVVFRVTVLESYIMSMGPAVVFIIVCMYARINIQLTFGAIMSAVYAIVMTVVLVGTVGTAVTGSITSPNVIFMVLLTMVFAVSGILHPRELGCLVPGVLYFICIPAGYLVLTIYFLCNIHVVSWGTREIPSPKTQDEIDKEKRAEEKKKKKNDKNRKGLLGWLGVRSILKEFLDTIKNLLGSRRGSTHGKEHFVDTSRKIGRGGPETQTNMLLRQLIDEVRLSRGAGSGRVELEQSQTQRTHLADQSSNQRFDQHRSHVNGYPNSKGNDDRTSSDEDEERLQTVHVETPESGSESSSHIPEEDPDRPSWIFHPSIGDGPIKMLGSRERVFWSQLMAKYLYPIVDEPHNKERIRKDLLFLRNNVVFAFFMSSAVWIALFMQLEILQEEIKDHMFVNLPIFSGEGTFTFQPLSLIFLGCFFIILTLQFMGMLGHRWGTMLHTLSITDVGFGSRIKEQNKVKEIIMRVTNLQKLKHIDLEPEPDYGDPLPDNPDVDYEKEVDDPATNNQVNFQHGFYAQETTPNTMPGHGNSELSPGWGRNPVQPYYTGGWDNPGPQSYEMGNVETSRGEGFYHGSSTAAPFSYRTQAAGTDVRGGRSTDGGGGGSVQQNQWGVLGKSYALENAFEKRFRNELRQRQQQVVNSHENNQDVNFESGIQHY